MVVVMVVSLAPTPGRGHAHLLPTTSTMLAPRRARFLLKKVTWPLVITLHLLEDHSFPYLVCHHLVKLQLPFICEKNHNILSAVLSSSRHMSGRAEH